MPTTRYRKLSKGGALMAISALVLSIAAMLAVAAAYEPPPPLQVVKRQADAVTYAKILDRMNAGEDYYEAVHAELIAGRYGTRSVFNWRTPFYLSLLSMLPSRQDASWLLTGLALCTALAIGTAVFREAGLWVAVPLALALVPSFLGYVAPSLPMFSEAPAGLLILLAIGLRGVGWRRLAVASGLVALFVRELAAPFVILLAAGGVAERRKDEIRAWAIGLAAYGVYFAWHAHMVGMTIGPMDRGYPEGWVQFGALGFVLATAHFNGAFWIMPIQVTAVVLPVALMGLIAWPGRTGSLALATFVLYVAAFTVIGKPLDIYWGLLYTPLIAVGLAWAPVAFADLIRAARAGGRSTALPTHSRS